jgi:hypothetical protein
MKLKVNRLLNAGKYHVNFEVGDFTPDELAKMASFGSPIIQLRWMSGSNRIASGIALNQINNRYDAIFDDEQEAKDYETGVLNQIRDAIARLRESQDKFSSSEEVDL